MAPNKSRIIWDHGVPLDEAWIHFSSEAERLLLENGPSGLQVANDRISRMALSPPDSLVPFVKGVSEAIQAGFAATRTKQETEDSLKESLLERILNNELVATGYRERPTRSTIPVVIDAEIFESVKPEWEKSWLSEFGLTYNRVRVTNLATIELVPIKTRSVGRPGSGEAIAAAITVLIRNETGFCDLDRKVACEKIRDHLGGTPIRGSGLSNQNLSKYILQACPQKRVSKSKK